MKLDADLANELRQRPRSDAAMALLCGWSGPLANSAASFTPYLASLAYFLWVCRNRAGAGMLSGRPQYEADETFRHRVTAAAACSGDLAGFGDVLTRRLGLSLAEFAPADVLWWREICASNRLVADQRTLTEAVVGAQLLRSWAGNRTNEAGWAYAPAQTLEAGA